MKKISYLIFSLLLFPLMMTSCFDDLEVTPLDEEEITSATVYDDPEAYQQVLAKLYAGLAVSGQQGPAGNADISGIDEGFGQYIRGYFNHQVLSTDEAVIGWDDQTIKDFVYHAWGSSDVFITAMYSRVFYQISLANEYLRQTTSDKLDERGVDDNLRNEIQIYRAEARFLRAFSYWHALDMFGGGVPFITEDNPIGSYLPEPISSTDLFEFIEGELLAIGTDLVEPPHTEYGRADKAAAWTLLAKLYLNAEIYIGEPHYSESLQFSEQVINAGYTLHDNYAELFMADNNPIQNPDLNEIIFAVRYDGINTQTFGGTNFIIHAQVGGSMNAANYGVDGGWGGLRTTPELVNLFRDEDQRAMFFTEGQSLEIDDLSDFTNGYAVVKFTNMRSDGNQGSNLEFTDTDFPFFRLADVYLMYAEAHLRGGGGDRSTAVGYFNALRERAFGDDSFNVSDIDLDGILDERARELYWEGHRRTDLIRFESFTGGDYLWTWKNNVKEGGATDAKYNRF
ncbi:MAG: RagB/SusD family nutrient uptake outer membrane protein, partial [Bacteroidota bacterium]